MRQASGQAPRLRDSMNTMPGATARSTRELLEALFRSAVAAAHPAGCLPPNLPDPPARGRLVILAAGKAAGAMTQVAEDHYADLPPTRLAGLAVTRHGYGRPTTSSSSRPAPATNS